jgi:REP element-mobilizing transposase RayT
MKLFLVSIFMIITAIYAQEKQVLFQTNYKQAMESYQLNKFSDFIYFLNKADSIRPNSYNVKYNLAAGLSKTNQLEKSFEKLKETLLLQAKFTFWQDSDFINIQNSIYKEKLESYYQNLKLEKKLSSISFTLKDKSIHPEGMAYDPNSKRYFFASIQKRTVIEIEKDKQNDQFLKLKEPVYAVLAVKIDFKNNNLWLASSAIPEMSGFTADLKGKSVIVKCNLKTGEELERFNLDGNHVFGDLIISASGDVYISDSGETHLYWIKKNTKKIELFLTINQAWNLQGLTFDKNEKNIFIADYIAGIFKINLLTKTIQKIMSEKIENERGLDGIYYFNGSILALQNGTSPKRVRKYQLNSEENKITKHIIYEQNNPNLNEPTQGLIYLNEFYYIGNSPWAAYDEKGQFNLESVNETIIYKVRID